MASPVIFIFSLSYVGRTVGNMMAAIFQPRAGRIINLIDQNPGSQGDAVCQPAALLAVTSPVPQPLKEAHLPLTARNLYRARRHIGSRVIKPELSVDLLYPD